MKNIILILACLLLVACAQVQQPSLKLKEDVAAATVISLQERIATYSEWDMHMRIALRHKKLSWRGIMQWQQHSDSFRIVFNDLLGRRLMLIESRDDGTVSAVDAKGYRRSAANASLLLKSLLGIEVSLDNLRYWLLGAPEPATSYANLEFDAIGRLLAYEQNGWTIKYTDFHSPDCAASVPANITLNNADKQLWMHIRSRQIPQDIIQTSIC